MKPKRSFFACLEARRFCRCRYVCLFWLKCHLAKGRACVGRRQLSGSTVRSVHDILFSLRVLQNRVSQNRNMTFTGTNKQTKNRILKNKPNHNRDQRKNGEAKNCGKQRLQERETQDGEGAGGTLLFGDAELRI